MTGRIITIILGKGWRCPETGPSPSWWPFPATLRTLMLPVGVPCRYWCITGRVWWGSSSPRGCIFHHLGPSFTRMPCLFPSCLSFVLFYCFPGSFYITMNNQNNSWYTLSRNCEPGSVSKKLHVLIHLIILKTLRYVFYFKILSKEWFCNFLKITVVCGKYRA